MLGEMLRTIIASVCTNFSEQEFVLLLYRSLGDYDYWNCGTPVKVKNSTVMYSIYKATFCFVLLTYFWVEHDSYLWNYLGLAVPYILAELLMDKVLSNNTECMQRLHYNVRTANTIVQLPFLKNSKSNRILNVYCLNKLTWT